MTTALRTQDPFAHDAQGQAFLNELHDPVAAVNQFRALHPGADLPPSLSAAVDALFKPAPAVAAPSPAPRRDEEHEAQVAVIAYARGRETTDERWARLHAIPNGGWRHPRTAARLAAEGVRPGISDLVWPVRSGRFPVLWLEMKAAKGRLTPAQADFLAAMRAEGHATAVCHSAAEAIETLERYAAGTWEEP
ncbi:MAG TPA: VRR-NUC domain-containing protein [Deinococcales bacterium]|nr:VRR-NUC domain-containing protein [Deinococcales bacterium]